METEENEKTLEMPENIEDPAAELARLKSELEKEKKEKEQLANQLSQNQNMKEGGEREESLAERFKASVPEKQLNESRKNERPYIDRLQSLDE